MWNKIPAMKFPHSIAVILFSAIFILSTGCSTESESKTENVPDGKSKESISGIEFFLIQDFSTIENTNGQIDENTIVLDEEPLIGYHDIIRYNTEEYAFTISDNGAGAIQKLEHSVRGVPFAVVADGELIYTGYFWPSYSSVSCDWMVIDPMMISADHEMKVRAGYPGLPQGMTIPDRRNDERILQILRTDGKLIL